ncbi:hypothetical protein TrRE_jg9933, partial [Triparma retinervis]
NSATVLASPGSSLATLLESVSISHGPKGVDYVMSKIREAIDHGIRGGEREDLETAEGAVEELLGRESILKDERAKEDILEAAFRDGSSVVCNICGGLIKRDRFFLILERTRWT